MTTTPTHKPTSAGNQKRARQAARRAAERRRRQRRWLFGLGAVAVIAAVVVVAVVGSSGSSNALDNTAADAFNLPRLGATGRVTLATHHGRPTVVNMFASWCDQCEAELPGFHTVATALKGKVDFVFVNSNETGNWRPMAERHQLLDFDVAGDVGGSLHNGLYRSFGGTGGMPLTAFYDDQGRLLKVFPGALVGANLTDALQQIYGISA